MWVFGHCRKLETEANKMRHHEIPPHLRHGREPTHEDIVERLERIEEVLRRVEGKF